MTEKSTGRDLGKGTTRIALLQQIHADYRGQRGKAQCAPMTVIYQHPDGDGQIGYAPGALLVSNDADGSLVRVVIGPDGLHELAAQLLALAENAGGVAS